MFDIGTKVIVLTSSLRKTAGPRRGSIGYVMSSLNNNGAYRDDLRLTMGACKVIFTRYGFEHDKSRKEKRVFFNLFPIVEKISKKDELPVAIKQVIKDLHKEKFDKELWKKLLKDWKMEPL